LIITDDRSQHNISSQRFNLHAPILLRLTQELTYNQSGSTSYVHNDVEKKMEIKTTGGLLVIIQKRDSYKRNQIYRKNSNDLKTPLGENKNLEYTATTRTQCMDL